MRGEEAVSSVVGTVLMLAVTLTAFTALGYVVLREFESQEAPPRADLSLERQSSSFLLVQQGGEPVPLGEARLIANVGGAERTTAVSAMPGAAALGPTLDLGEALCIQGPDPARCLYRPAHEVRGVFLVAGDFLLAAVGPRGDPSLPVPLLPDLAIAAVAWTPPSPVTPEAVTFQATLSNLGGATAGGVTVAFRVDGVLLGTVDVAGPIAEGASTVVSSPPWTSAPGSHSATATADPAGAVAEADETNNARTTLVDVAAGRPDPGFPFADANGDGLYAAGTDTAIPTAQVADGVYDCPAGLGLIVPPSVGAITAATIDIACDGAVTFASSLTSTSGATSVTSGGTITLASGSTVSSAGALTLAPQGMLLANGTTLLATGALTLGASQAAQAGTSFYLNGATLDATPATGDVAIQLLGTLDLTGASVSGRGDALFGGYTAANAAQSVLLAGAVIDLTGGTGDLELLDIAGPISGAGSATRLLARGAIALAAAEDIDLSQATLDNSASSNGLEVSGRSLNLAGTTVRSVGNVGLLGSGTTTCAACSVTTSGDVTVTGQGGTMDVRGASLAAGSNDDLRLTVATGSQVLVDGATFRDRNDRADVTPNGAAVGTPLSGGVE